MTKNIIGIDKAHNNDEGAITEGYWLNGIFTITKVHRLSKNPALCDHDFAVTDDVFDFCIHCGAKQLSSLKQRNFPMSIKIFDLRDREYKSVVVQYVEGDQIFVSNFSGTSLSQQPLEVFPVVLANVDPEDRSKIIALRSALIQNWT